MGNAVLEELEGLAQGDTSEEAEEFLTALEERDETRLAKATKEFVNHLVNDGTIEAEDAPNYLNGELGDDPAAELSDDDGDGNADAEDAESVDEAGDD